MFRFSKWNFNRPMLKIDSCVLLTCFCCKIMFTSFIWNSSQKTRKKLKKIPCWNFCILFWSHIWSPRYSLLCNGLCRDQIYFLLRIRYDNSFEYGILMIISLTLTFLFLSMPFLFLLLPSACMSHLPFHLFYYIHPPTCCSSAIGQLDFYACFCLRQISISSSMSLQANVHIYFIAWCSHLID